MSGGARGPSGRKAKDHRQPSLAPLNGIIAVRGNNSDFRPRGNSASLRRFLHATIACHYCLRTTFSEEPAASDDPADLLSRTESFWRDWSNHCRQTLRTP